MALIEKEGAAKELLQANSHLFKLIYNYVSSMSLRCAVELDIPDIIHKHGHGGITFTELVSSLGITHPHKIHGLLRLMRLLVHSGFFAKTEQQEAAYVLTPSSKMFLKEKSYCYKPLVMALTDPVFVNPCQFLGRWFRGDAAADEVAPFEIAHGGLSVWDYAEKNPEFNNLFNEAMACDSSIANLVVKDCKPIFKGLGSLVDVGGGIGSFSRIICQAFPGIRCTVLDLPHVIPNNSTDDSTNEHLKFIAGDMFHSIPPADAFFFKLIFHAFVDEDCLKILRKCREAMGIGGSGGKLIIIDIVINEERDEGEVTEAKLLYDMVMMVAVKGIERTENEWKRLFLDAGFTRYKISPLYGIKSLIEVFP